MIPKKLSFMAPGIFSQSTSISWTYDKEVLKDSYIWSYLQINKIITNVGLREEWAEAVVWDEVDLLENAQKRWAFAYRT